MNEPLKPKDPPSEGAAPDANPAGNTPNGIPDDMQDAEPKGRPTNDRHKTEISPHKD